MTKHRLLVAAFAGALVALPAMTQAQPMGPGGGPIGPGMGPGSMMGPGMMGPGMHRRMCSPDAAGFAEWRIDRLERSLRLSEAQRPKFEELKAASNKAAEAMRAACPSEFPAKTLDRMTAMEKRLDAMLAAVKTMRPAMEAFYAALSDEQKARLDAGAGPGRFWRWRHAW